MDQMFRVELGELLQREEHDVLRTAEAGQATADDAEVLQRAIEQDRLLVTMDEHFGDWAILPLASHPGVVRLKAHPATTANIAKLIVPFLRLHSQDELRNYLVILSRSGERWIKTTRE